MLFRGVSIALACLSMVAEGMIGVLCLSLPRRPAVTDKGYAVDAQLSVSALRRWSFGWAMPLLEFAKLNGGLDMSDLPILHAKMRSTYLHDSFKIAEQGEQLWKALLRRHWKDVAYQSGLAAFQGVVSFAPQYALFQLLKLLESRALASQMDTTLTPSSSQHAIFSDGASRSHGSDSFLTSLQPWHRSIHKTLWSQYMWVLGLGISVLLSSWIETWLHWIIWSNMGAPVRSELSAMIFTKFTRRKDVTGAADQGSEECTKADAGDDIQKTRQGIINLIGVDAKRVSDFFTFYYLYSQSITKLCVSVVFLSKLIGWKSLLAGFGVFIVLLPLNLFVSTAYTRNQDDLMKARDKKMVVVSEALQGIRQIKFSSLEMPWQEKIGQKRAVELAKQWRTFHLSTTMIGVWLLGPLALSAVSLAVYAILHEGLSASVAFTTISIFSSIEMTLAVIPELTSDGLDAWVSAKRIGEFLSAPEQVDYTTPSQSISFENASVSWPSDSIADGISADGASDFMLENVNLSFPERELSVISGRTGSGKSLLLAAILGEAEMRKGAIKVPKAPSFAERQDAQVNKSDWIINTSMAYVTQIPYIENATLRDNILFGLPYDSDRYKKAVAACALTKDFEMLPDGDVTDVGANGVNLSGGQKWRISFARAIYSRAGILVLDDIFSAVDAHVGRHLLEEALVGELGRNRTRILVTHHVKLCLPCTKYLVHLDGGGVKYAGQIDELHKRGHLQRQSTSERLEELEHVTPGIDVSENSRGSLLTPSTNGHTIHKIATNGSAKIDESEIDTRAKKQPKKFNEDEGRESGSVKWAVYWAYFCETGNLWFWALVLALFVGNQGFILLRSWWIGQWTRSTTHKVLTTVLFSTSNRHPFIKPTAISHSDDNLWYYLWVYLGLSVLLCFFGVLKYLIMYMGSIRASRQLFNNFCFTVLRAPLRWFDTVPVGRILNRFTADFLLIDSRFCNDFAFLIYEVIQLIGIIVASVFVSPWMLIAASLLIVPGIVVALKFLPGAREVKRLESNAKSPIFELFGAALIGIGTIRGYGRTTAYTERMFERIDEHARTFWYSWLFNRWIMFWLNNVGALFSVLIAAVIVANKSVDAALAGFALSFSLQYSSALVCYPSAWNDVDH